MSASAARDKATPEVAFCFAFNHVLRAEDWARERLAPFAGEALELRAPPLPALRLRIEPEGTLAPGGEAPSLVVTLKPELIPALARGEEHAMRAIEVAGNARLANEVLALARHLRWDFEEDLSRVLGDVAAHRVAGAARAFAAWHVETAGRLATAFAAYAVEEKRLLVSRPELEALAHETARLRDALERLDKRVARLA